jgi:ABC-type lipoprotein release transport system permease subunit
MANDQVEVMRTLGFPAATIFVLVVGEGLVVSILGGAMGAVLSVAVMCHVPQRAAAAGKYDGSAPMICGAMLVTECGAEGRCSHTQSRSAK